MCVLEPTMAVELLLVCINETLTILKKKRKPENPEYINKRQCMYSHFMSEGKKKQKRVCMPGWEVYKLSPNDNVQRKKKKGKRECVCPVGKCITNECG